MAPGSEPASGSDCANAVVFSPRRTGKRYFSFCTGVSVNRIGFTSGPNTPGPRGGSAMLRVISSQTTTMPSRPRPWPPYSVGTSSSHRPKSFALRSRSARSSGRSEGLSIADISIGMSSRSTKVLTVFLRSLSSSGRSKSMPAFLLLVVRLVSFAQTDWLRILASHAVSVRVCASQEGRASQDVNASAGIGRTTQEENTMSCKAARTTCGSIAASVTLAFSIWLNAGAAVAHDYPSRPIKIIAGFPPGGGVDLVSRLIGQGMSNGLRQPIVVENKPGAAGIIGAAQAAKSDPDGYTLLVTPGGHSLFGAVFQSVPFDTVASFSWISNVINVPFFIVVRADSKFQSLTALIAEAKNAPGEISFGSAGPGS